MKNKRIKFKKIWQAECKLNRQAKYNLVWQNLVNENAKNMKGKTNA